jgi:heat shock protein HslJ
MYWKSFISVLGIVLFSACTRVDAMIGENDLELGKPAEGDVVENDLAKNDLVETEWVLTSLNGEPLLEGTNITLAFFPSELSGFTGCNGYGSQYEIDGIGGIKFLEIVSQAEGCVEPEGVLDQESKYLKQLLHTEKYSMEGNELTLSIPASEQILVYSLREPFDMDPASLDGTTWILIPSDSFPLKVGSIVTLSFSNGEIAGFAGCRDIAGEYKAEGDEIVFPVTMMIGELCDDFDLQIQEAKFTTWLELSTHYRIFEDQLGLFLADGNELLFERTE